jgi:hypothetical protein
MPSRVKKFRRCMETLSGKKGRIMRPLCVSSI